MKYLPGRPLRNDAVGSLSVIYMFDAEVVV